MDKEIRILATEIELREQEDKKRTITGYGVKWEQLSEKLGWLFRFREKFQKGAFDDSLRDDQQKALWNHNTDIVIGSTRSGTLRLTSDDTGLRFEIDLPDSEWGSNVYEAIRRKDVDGVSFGFKKQGEEWDEADPDNVVRTITKAKLFEVSPTPFPAYPQSEVQARNTEKAYEEYRETVKKPEPVTQKPDLTEQRKDFNRIKNKLLEVN